MYKVKELYVPVEDDGDTYLVKESDYPAFSKCLDRIGDSYESHLDEDIYNDEFMYLLDTFGVGRLEGETHYVVLEKDLVKEK